MGKKAKNPEIKMNFPKFRIGQMTNREIFVKIFHIFLGLTISNIIFSAINVSELEWEIERDEYEYGYTYYQGYFRYSKDYNTTKVTKTEIRQNTLGQGFISLAATIPINIFLYLIKLKGFSKCRDVTFIIFTVLSWEVLLATITFQSVWIESEKYRTYYAGKTKEDKHALHDFCLWAGLIATVGLLIMSFVIFGLLCKKLCCHEQFDQSSIPLISNVEVVTHDEENPEISVRKENGKKIITVNTTKAKTEGVDSTYHLDQSESVSINQKSSIVKNGNKYKPLEEY